MLYLNASPNSAIANPMLPTLENKPVEQQVDYFLNSEIYKYDKIYGSLEAIFRLDGNDSNATPINSPTYEDAPALQDKTGVLLNGIDEYMDADAISTSVANIIADGPFSVTAWVRLDDSGSFYIICEIGDPNTSSGFRFVIIDDGRLRIRANGSNKTGSVSVDDGDWHFVVVTSSGTGGTYSFYVDGSFGSSGAIPAYNLTGANLLKIGVNSSASFQFLPGVIDDLRLYGRCLSSSEIRALYLHQEPV